MNTPICDFVRGYAARDVLRLHMPGHKGCGPLGCEALDITEIGGADSLYEASGIIRKSEENASLLFGCPTFYSTEGSSQCIRAMLHLVALYARLQGNAPRIAAARNAHKTFLSAAALLDLEVDWLYPTGDVSYLACPLTAQDLDRQLSRQPATAVYVTNPDYLGNLQPIRDLAEVCHQHGALLLVDNAHGAYLRFMPASQHPVDLGADLCCDSAHKTLPVLTGGAYLHIAAVHTPLIEQAKNALALFGSTSPSYLIMQSLDAANVYMDTDYRDCLADFAAQTAQTKERLLRHGYKLQGTEPLKLTLCTKDWGWLGTDLSTALEDRDVISEFADPDYLVFMLTPEIGAAGLERLERALMEIPQRAPIATAAPRCIQPERVMGVREAMLAPCETVPAEEALGRVLSAATVGCPPAVPIVVCGERIDAASIAAFAYYGIDSCNVIK